MEWIRPFSDIQELTQGSIIDGVDWGNGADNPLSIVLSNACDLSYEGHCSYLIVAALYPMYDIISSSREFLGIVQDGIKELTKAQRRQIDRLFDDYIFNRTITRYYFIDCSIIEPDLYLFVDYQHIKSVPFQNVEYKPIAHLVSPLREQMMMRFVFYTGRVPVDRPDGEQYEKIVGRLRSFYMDVKE